MGSKEEIVAAIAETGTKIKAIKEEKVLLAAVTMLLHMHMYYYQLSIIKPC